MIDLELLVQPQRSLGEQSLSGMLRSRATLVSQGTPYAQQASQQITECDHVRCEVRLQKGGAGAPAATPRPPTPGPQNLANGGLLGWASAGPRGWVHQNGQLWDATRRESSVGINNWGCRPPAWAICMYVGVWQRSKHEFEFKKNLGINCRADQMQNDGGPSTL